MRSLVSRRLLLKMTSKRKAAIKNHPDEGKDPEKVVAEVLQQRKGTENHGSIVNQYVESAPSTACAQNIEPAGGYRKKRRSKGEKKRKIIDSITDPELGGISSQKKVCVVSSSFVDQSHLNSEIRNVKLPKGEYRKTRRGREKKKRKIIDSITNPELGGISSQKKVSPSFVDQSHLNSEIRDVKLPSLSSRKLIILDLNGILADIRSEPLKGSKPDKLINHKAVYKRPFCDDFLQFSFETFDVAVWSSRNRVNVQQMLTFLMSEVKRKKMIFTRDQSHCTKTGFMTMENKDKPIFLKELQKFWSESKVYNKSNTLLIDDSPYKALYNPPYTSIFPKTYECSNDKDDSLGPDGDLRLYLKKLAEADNVQKFVKKNPFGQIPITSSHTSWDFYSKVIALKLPE